MKKPELRDVQNFMYKSGQPFDLAKDQGERFINYYESCGWLVSKGKPMKSWKSSVRNWLKNMNTFAPKSEVKFIVPTIKPDEKEREETRKGYDRLRAEASFSKANGFGTETQEKIKAMLKAGKSTYQIIYQLRCRRELVYSVKSKLKNE